MRHTHGPSLEVSTTSVCGHWNDNRRLQFVPVAFPVKRENQPSSIKVFCEFTVVIDRSPAGPTPVGTPPERSASPAGEEASSTATGRTTESSTLEAGGKYQNG